METQAYFINDHVEDFLDGFITRRELVKLMMQKVGNTWYWQGVLYLRR